MYGYIILIVVSLVLIIIIAINMFSDRLLLMPSYDILDIKEPRQDIYLNIPNVNLRLHAWFFEWFPRSKYPNAKYVIYCHGNAGNISHREFIINICKHANCNLLLFDYRGFGLSAGQAHLSQLMEDGEIAYLWLRQIIKNQSQASISIEDQTPRADNNIIVWGESMGGSVAIHLAQKYNPSGLILLATFSALSDLIIDHLGDGIGNLLLMTTYGVANYPKSRELIKKVQCPITILHSVADDLIPIKHALKLEDCIQHHNKQLIKIEGSHSKPKITEAQFEQLFKFHNVSFYHMNNIYASYRQGIPSALFK